jgi:hypothetical protein
MHRLQWLFYHLGIFHLIDCAMRLSFHGHDLKLSDEAELQTNNGSFAHEIFPLSKHIHVTTISSKFYEIYEILQMHHPDPQPIRKILR